MRAMALTVVDTDEQLQELLSSDRDRLFILKLGATWCAPCEEAQPAFEALSVETSSQKRNTTCIVINKTDDNEAIFDEHEITKLPTFILFQNGEVKAKIPRPDPAGLMKVMEPHLPLPALVLDEDF